jgi:hypothetical protein
MFGSFLPSLWSLSNHSLLGPRSRHCYAITSRWRGVMSVHDIKLHELAGDGHVVGLPHEFLVRTLLHLPLATLAQWAAQWIRNAGSWPPKSLQAWRATKLQAARDADIEKERSYYLERTRSAPGFQVTKNSTEHQMNCALEQISTRTSACSCAVRNLPH